MARRQGGSFKEQTAFGVGGQVISGERLSRDWSRYSRSRNVANTFWTEGPEAHANGTTPGMWISTAEAVKGQGPRVKWSQTIDDRSGLPSPSSHESLAAVKFSTALASDGVLKLKEDNCSHSFGARPCSTFSTGGEDLDPYVSLGTLHLALPLDKRGTQINRIFFPTISSVALRVSAAPKMPNAKTCQSSGWTSISSSYSLLSSISKETTRDDSIELSEV